MLIIILALFVYVSIYEKFVKIYLCVSHESPRLPCPNLLHWFTCMPLALQALEKALIRALHEKNAQLLLETRQKRAEENKITCIRDYIFVKIT